MVLNFLSIFALFYRNFQSQSKITIKYTILIKLKVMEVKQLMKKVFFAPFTRLIVGFFVLMLIMILVPSVMRNMMNGSKLMQIVGTLVFVGISLGTYALLFRYYEHRKITELSFSGFGKKVSTGFGIGFLLISIVAVVMLVLGVYHIDGVNYNQLIWYYLVMAMSAGVIEELLLRGVVFRLVEEKLGTTLALLISAFIFGFMHIINPNASIWASIAISIEAGILLGAAYAMTRNLWFPICIHWAWNFTEGYIYGFAISGGATNNSLFVSSLSGPGWLTGGAFGAEASVVTVLVCSLASTWFLWRTWQKKNWIFTYWHF